jgi:hypothetical protein
VSTPLSEAEGHTEGGAMGEPTTPKQIDPKLLRSSDDTDARREARRCVGRSDRSAQRLRFLPIA